MKGVNYFIHVESNAVSEFTKATAASKGFTKAVEKNQVAFQTRDQILKNTIARQSKLKNLTDKLRKSTGKLTKSTIISTVWTNLMSRASQTAGYNIGGLSLRISTGLVPVLAIMYTAMLPVAAGLLAIASAAIVATGGVLGLMGVGLYAWSKRFKATSTGYGGARRPYSGNEEPDFFKELTKGFDKVLKIDEIAKMINEAVIFTQDIFGTTLPEAFRRFMMSVDMGVMRTIMKLFTEWLPDAAEGLAKWGSSLFKSIGSGSLKRINDLFKYLGRGILSIADWLKQTDFKSIDGLTSILSQLMSQLMQLGKNILPVLVNVLKSVYPNPIKPILNILIRFFDWLSKSEKGMGVITKLTQLLIIIVAVGAALNFVAALAGIIGGIGTAIEILGLALAALGITISLPVAIIAALIAGLVLLGVYLYKHNDIFKSMIDNTYTLIINTFTAVYNHLAKLFGFIHNLFSDDKVDWTKDYRDYSYGSGASINASKQTVTVENKITVDDNQFGIGVLDTMSGQLKGVRGGFKHV